MPEYFLMSPCKPMKRNLKRIIMHIITYGLLLRPLHQRIQCLLIKNGVGLPVEDTRTLVSN